MEHLLQEEMMEKDILQRKDDLEMVIMVIYHRKKLTSEDVPSLKGFSDFCLFRKYESLL